MNKAAEAHSSNDQGSGALAPLRLRVFRVFWLASLGSNIGTLANSTTSGWVMTTLSPSPVMVSLVQAAAVFPTVLFALPAGAFTDIVNRRRYLLITQIWLALSAGGLTFLAASDQLDAWNLLILTLALGLGGAMATPALNVTAPELVPRNLLPQAVALGSLSMNISRALGPALAGLLLAQLGAWAAYGMNALSFIGMIVMLLYWKHQPEEHLLPPERFFQALRAGIRYVRMASPFRAVLIRTAAFVTFTAAVWALLPLIARNELATGPATYGFLLTFVGLGAVAVIVILPRLHPHVSRDRLVLAGSIVFGLTTVAIATVSSEAVLYLIMVVCGAAWVSVLSSLQVAAQISVPAWVRGRALALYIMVFSASLALGSLIWGWIASHTNTPAALLISAVTLILTAIAVRKFSLGSREAPDLSPSYHWPHPPMAEEPGSDRGPVLVTLEYQVALEQRQAFVDAIRELGRIRRRDGAFGWGVFEDIAMPGRYIEFFQHASWLDHLRQHGRITREDQRVQEKVNAFHTGSEPPMVSHFVAGAPPVATDSSTVNIP